MVLENAIDEKRFCFRQSAALDLDEQLFQINGFGVAAQVNAAAQESFRLIKVAGFAGGSRRLQVDIDAGGPDFETLNEMLLRPGKIPQAHCFLSFPVMPIGPKVPAAERQSQQQKQANQ